VYESYVVNVSPAALALSWEALRAISETLECEGPKSILEYGSGISTILLATYAREHGIYVDSFDSDRDWTEKTISFITEQGLNEWAQVEFAETVVPLPLADFILWDFDRNPKRVDLMAAAFRNLATGGIMYVDDMHNSEIAAACAALGGELLSTVDRDGFGRYGVFLRKTSLPLIPGES